MHTCGHTLGFGAAAALELIDAPRDLSLEPLLRLQLGLPHRYRYTRAQYECESVRGECCGCCGVTRTSAAVAVLCVFIVLMDANKQTKPSHVCGCVWLLYRHASSRFLAITACMHPPGRAESVSARSRASETRFLDAENYNRGSTWFFKCMHTCTLGGIDANAVVGDNGGCLGIHTELSLHWNEGI